MSHRTELRDRVVKDSYCIQSGCEYEGKPSVQGHCHTVLDKTTDNYLRRLAEEAERSLAGIKEIAGSEYLEHLESYYLCVSMNWASAVDELVRLRRENARLTRIVETGSEAGGGASRHDCHVPEREP